MSGQSNRRRSHVRITARLAAGVLVAAAAITGFAGVATAAGGNNGTVKIGSKGAFPTNQNDPHLTCPIDIQWTGFDPAKADYTVTLTGINPTGGTVTAAELLQDSFTGGSAVRTFTLTINGATPNNKGEDHIRIDIQTTDANGSDFKQKTVWVTPCGAPPGQQTLSLSGHCNTAGTGYDWTVSTAPSTDGVSVSWTSGAQNGTVTTGAPAAAGTATITNTTASTASVTAAGWTGASNVQASPLCGPAPRNLQLQAACTQPLAGTITWTVTNPAGNPTVTGLSSSNSALTGSPSLAPGANTTFTSNAPATTAVTVSGMAGAIPVSSNGVSLSNSCAAGQVETPASVSFSSTCDGIHAVFTSASLHSTHFVVSAPDGTTDTFNGDATKDYAATQGAGHLSVSYDGKSDVYNWKNPGAAVCNPPPPPAGQADPAVTADKACKAGISVVLSNMDGTADVTFTVTDPDGKVHQVPVRAGQLVKESYAVTEDTTGVVTVTAPGLAKKTITYDKNCSTVLGIRHVRHPHTVVLGERKTRTPESLPFTGYDPQRSLFTAAELLLVGGLLCGVASIRRRPSA